MNEGPDLQVKGNEEGSSNGLWLAGQNVFPGTERGTPMPRRTCRGPTRHRSVEIRFVLGVAALALATLPGRAVDGVTNQEILIGSSLPLAGPFSPGGQKTKQGVEASFAAVNAAGGVHDRFAQVADWARYKR